MISYLAFIKTIYHSVSLCIVNNLITTYILYCFMKTFLGYKPNFKKTSVILYSLFFIFENALRFTFQIYLRFGINEEYLTPVLYSVLFIIVVSIAFCYKPTFSAGLTSATLTILSLYCSVSIADCIFSSLYQMLVSNFDILSFITTSRHIFYIIFEKYQQCFVYILEIIVKLVFLFVIYRTRKIYEERNIYYLQASNQQTNNTELKQFRHDIKNHVGALNQMITSNEIDKALKYLATMNDISDASKLLCNTGNVALDSIVNYKLSIAKKAEIKCTFHALIPTNINIKDKDIIIIMGNLLDNAIEACSKLSSDKYIKVDINYKKGILFIFISNNYNGTTKKNGSNFVTLKSNSSLHGLGLKNVQKSISNYNGTLEINETSSEFNVFVMLYVNATL